jgi:hypothetical protein
MLGDQRRIACFATSEDTFSAWFMEQFLKTICSSKLLSLPLIIGDKKFL